MTRPMGLNGPWDSNDFSSAINKNPRLNMPKLRLFEKGALRKKLKKKKKKKIHFKKVSLDCTEIQPHLRLRFK